jgi:acyl-coenzyme A thioesterase PaaI-like protein
LLLFFLIDSPFVQEVVVVVEQKMMQKNGYVFGGAMR